MHQLPLLGPITTGRSNPPHAIVSSLTAVVNRNQFMTRGPVPVRSLLRLVRPPGLDTENTVLLLPPRRRDRQALPPDLDIPSTAQLAAL
jgi:hypothetical protein